MLLLFFFLYACLYIFMCVCLLLSLFHVSVRKLKVTFTGMIKLSRYPFTCYSFLLMSCQYFVVEVQMHSRKLSSLLYLFFVGHCMTTVFNKTLLASRFCKSYLLQMLISSLTTVSPHLFPYYFSSMFLLSCLLKTKFFTAFRGRDRPRNGSDRGMGPY